MRWRFLMHQQHRSVVAENIDSSVAIEGFPGHRLDLRFVRNIGLDKQRFAAFRNRLCRGFSVGGVDFSYHHGRSLGAETLGNGPADASARTGDDCDFVLQSHAYLMFSFRLKPPVCTARYTIPATVHHAPTRMAKGEMLNQI